MTDPNMMGIPAGGPPPGADAGADDGSSDDGKPTYDCTCPDCGAKFTVEIDGDKAEPEGAGGDDQGNGDSAGLDDNGGFKFAGSR